MAQTKPRSEQIRFESAATGSHVLDTYLEGAERGGRTLASLLSDIFNSSGLLTPGYLEFQVTSAGQLQYRTAGSGAWTSLIPIFVDRGSWATSTAYNRLDTVLFSGNVYLCLTAHTASASFATDAANWRALITLAGNPVYYRGTFDASAGYPSSPAQGDLYVASVAGTISSVDYGIGDMAFYNGSSWDRIENNANDRVLRSGDTMTGHLNVPAGASGTQAPRAQEVVPATREVSVLSIEAPENGDYYLTHYAPTAIPVEAISVITSAGTCTVAIKHGSGPTTLATLSASTTVNETTSPSATIPKGDPIYVTISSVSSAENLYVNLIGAV